MAIEHARTTAVPKPWGSADLRPWSSAGTAASPIGEIWYERSAESDADSSLLLKLLFTTQPLSIQVHPGDSYAHSIGLSSGKTEAWYILKAAAGAAVALGFQQPMTAPQLFAAIEDGSIVKLASWREVAQDDVVLVPAGTVHALGAGLVIAEVQQRVDATFRMFDFGRQRELQVEHAVAVADRNPAAEQPMQRRVSAERCILTQGAYFVLERLDLPDATDWLIAADRETWLLVLHGSARAGEIEVTCGDALFAQIDQISIRVRSGPFVCLVAYTGAGGPVLDLYAATNVVSTHIGKVQ